MLTYWSTSRHLMLNIRCVSRVFRLQFNFHVDARKTDDDDEEEEGENEEEEKRRANVNSLAN